MPTKIKSQPQGKTINPDVKAAVKAILDKRPLYNTLLQYYQGDHPLRYSTERLKKAFSKMGVYFAQNWIAVVVDSVLDRLALKGFEVSDDEEADDMLDQVWEDTYLNLISEQVHEAASLLSEAFVIAWLEEDPETQEEFLDVYYNDPRNCHMFYDPYRPSVKRCGAKMWIGSDRYPRLILYYTDRLEHYKATSAVSSIEGSTIMSSSNFIPDPEFGDGDGIETHEYGIIPMFHFHTGRATGKKEIGKSEIALQDAVNKLFADMMVGSEFSTFTQRVIISQADPGDLKNEAGNNWYIPAGDGKGQSSSVTELGNKTLTNYIDAIDHVAHTLAIITRTPKHYLLLTAGDPSGDALLAMEAPLVKKVQKRIASYAREWKSLALFLLVLKGKEDIKPSQVSSSWEPVTSSQPMALATTVKTETEAGIPLVTSVRRHGWTKEEIQAMEEDQKKERKTQSAIAQQELARLRAEQASSNQNSDGDISSDAK